MKTGSIAKVIWTPRKKPEHIHPEGQEHFVSTKVVYWLWE